MSASVTDRAILDEAVTDKPPAPALTVEPIRHRSGSLPSALTTFMLSGHDAGFIPDVAAGHFAPFHGRRLIFSFWRAWEFRQR